jgi:hypothetical protein
MKIEGDQVTFSTGKKVYVNCGIIGLSPDLDVSAGYDNGWFSPTDGWHDEDGIVDPQSRHYLTPAEQAELADYMLEQWQKFKARAVHVVAVHVAIRT